LAHKKVWSLDIGIFTPIEGGPFPAVIMPGGHRGRNAVTRLPQGPGQGTGVDALLKVGPAETKANESSTRAVPTPGGGSALTAAGIALAMRHLLMACLRNLQQ